MPSQAIMASSATVQTAAGEELEEACRAAVEATEGWRKTSASHRRDVLQTWAQAIDARSAELARGMAVEISKPVRDGRAEVHSASNLIRAAANRCADNKWIEPLRASTARFRLLPHGVVAIITPWNNPLAIPAGKIAPAVALGNTVVWKPAIHAKGTSSRLLELGVGAGLPRGVLSMVHGGSDVASELIDHPGVRAVSLTGATATGRAAAARCAARGVPFQAELGGNNAAIVLSDYDFRPNMRQLVQASFSFAGQRCTAIRRWIVERPILEEFKRSFVAGARALKLGDPLDEITDVGPLICREQRAGTVAAVARAIADGAKLLYGGDVPSDLGDGYFVRPAVLDSVTPGSWIAQRETFGPIAMLLEAEDLDHALAIANNVEHGLVCMLLSNDLRARGRFLERAEAGILRLAPDPLVVCPEAPFGGWKASGIGLPEHGEWDVHFYTKAQAIYEPER